jgi:hypothetical protein
VHYEDIARERNASVEIIPPKGYGKNFRCPRREKNDGFEILSRVKRTGLGIMCGHMDLAILSTEGKV